MKCAFCKESPDWGGYYICLGCGKAICYSCQHKHIVDYFEEFNVSYYDDPHNTDEGCHGETWYLCHDCYQRRYQINNTRYIRYLHILNDEVEEMEKQIESKNREMCKLFETEYKDYKHYTTSHRAT
jgi:hypothetical protein